MVRRERVGDAANNKSLATWRAEPAALKSRYFEIKHDPEAGYYFFAWENQKWAEDELRDTFSGAADFALENFGVPKDAWKKVIA